MDIVCIMSLKMLMLLLCLRSSIGETEYYSGAMKGASNITLELRCASGTCNVTVDAGNFTKSYEELQDTATVFLPDELEVTSSLERHKGVRVLSNDSLSVIMSQGNSDAFRVLPYKLAGPPYHQYTYHAVGVSRGSQILLVGCVQGTEVTLSPSQDVSLPEDFGDANSVITTVSRASSRTFQLNEMDTLLVESDKDLTGTKIVSNWPLTVLSGSLCESCSFTAEQLPPASAWGRTYLLPSVVNGHYQVVASQNHTTVNHTCSNGEMFLISEGDAERQNVTSSCRLSADAPVMVVQYLSDVDAAVTTLMSPMEQYVDELLVHPLSCGGDNGTITLVATDQATLSVSLQWAPVPDVTGIAGYLATIDLLSITTLTNNSQLTATVTLLNDICSYGYNAGYNVASLQVSTVFFASSSYIVEESVGEVQVEIQRVDVLQSRLSITVDKDGDRQVVVFGVGETRKNYSLLIIDDNIAMEDKTFSLLLMSEYPVNFGNNSVSVTVLDNDNVTVSVTSLLYQSRDAMLSVTVAVGGGAIDGVCVEVQVIVAGKSATYDVQLTAVVVSHTATIDLGSLAPDHTQNTSVSVLLNTSNARVVLLDSNFTRTLGDILEARVVDFVVGEFTQLTLLVTVCLGGAVLLMLLVFITVTVCVAMVCYRRGKRWSVSGAHMFSPQGDTLMVSTTDPGTYELMNRLGENKATSLLINDDRDFASL